jgi:hypothetical protein
MFRLKEMFWSKETIFVVSVDQRKDAFVSSESIQNSNTITAEVKSTVSSQIKTNPTALISELTSEPMNIQNKASDQQQTIISLTNTNVNERSGQNPSSNPELEGIIQELEHLVIGNWDNENTPTSTNNNYNTSPNSEFKTLLVLELI